MQGTQKFLQAVDGTNLAPIRMDDVGFNYSSWDLQEFAMEFNCGGRFLPSVGIHPLGMRHSASTSWAMTLNTATLVFALRGPKTVPDRQSPYSQLFVGAAFL